MKFQAHTLLVMLCCWALVVAGGYVIQRNKVRWLGWILLLVTILFAWIAGREETPVTCMFILIITLFLSMKVIAASFSQQPVHRGLRWIPWLAFSLGWAGMRANLFESLGEKPILPIKSVLIKGLKRMLTGVLLLLLAHAIHEYAGKTGIYFLLITILLMAGFSLLLHFGLLTISAGIWRSFGIPAPYLFNDPARSATVSEFWSKRWNLAFSEMISVAVYRPVKNVAGTPVATITGFLFSGLLHELAITLPVGSGYGLPTLYFAIQGMMVLLEKSGRRKENTLLSHPVTARCWTAFRILAPVPLLFPVAFIQEIIWPLAGL